MKICPNCNSQVEENAKFCNVCGYNFENQNNNQNDNQNTNAEQQPYQGQPYQQQYQQPNQQQYQNPGYQCPPNYAPQYNPYDHTKEFESEDVSNNKIYAMCPYLLGTIGIIIALLANKNSPYLSFHIRQAVKLTVTEILLVICMLVLFFTIIVPIAGAISLLIVTVLRIIAFFQICSGKSVEPAIIRSLGFLK